MSTLVDEKIVSMKFDSAQFERGVQSAIQSTNNLKKNLNFDDTAESMSELSRAAGKVNMNPLLDSIKSVGDSFNAAGIVAFSVINRMTNAAIDAGVKITKALTITPMTTGLNEYELKMGSIQTIMASTKKPLAEVNEKLDELNEYSDRTIYSFADMTQNIGKFTNAGVDLGVAVNAMRGLMNEAALSGANAAEASRAMYNLAQSISMGYVQLIDWKSIENANMATLDFKRNLAEMADELGIAKKIGDDMYAVGDKTYTIQQLFKDGLKEQWLTTDVLTKTLSKYQDESTDLGKRAYAAAQDLKTFTQMVDTLKEAMQSGWAQSWQLIFGDFEEAKRLWTTVGNALNGLIGQIDSFRNKALEVANALGMRENLLQSFMNIMTAFGQVLYSIKEAADAAFGGDTFKGAKSSMSFFAGILLRISEVIRDITEKLVMNKDAQQDIITILTAVFSVIRVLWDTTNDLYSVVAELLGVTMPMGKFLRKLVVILAKLVIVITAIISKTKIISGSLKLIAATIGLVAAGIGFLVMEVINLLDNLPSVEQIFIGITNGIGDLHRTLSTSSNPIIQLLEKVFIFPFYMMMKVWQLGFYDIGQLPKLLINYFKDSFRILKTTIHSWFNGDSFEMFAPIKNVFLSLAEFIGRFNWKQALKVGGFMYMLTFVTTMVINITKLIDVFYSFGSTIRMLGKALSDVMKSMANFVNAQAFDMFVDSMKKVAIVVMAMAGLSLVFGLLKEDSFNRAMVALERLALVVGTATAVLMSIYYIMTTIKTIGTAASVDSFSDAIAVIGKSFATGLSKSMKILANGLAFEHILFGIAAAMVAIATAFGIITDALMKCDPTKINTADVVFVLIGTLAAASSAMALASKLGNPAVMDAITINLIAMASSVMIIAKAFELFGQIDLDAITLGLTSLSAVAGITTIMAIAASKFPTDYKSLLGASVLLVSFGGALIVLCESIKFVHNVLATAGLGRFIADLFALNAMMLSFSLAIMLVSFTVRGFSKTVYDSGNIIANAADVLSSLGMAAVILSMAAAIRVLVDAVQSIGMTDVEIIQNGLYYMTIILSEFALFIFVVSKTVASSVKSAGGYFLGIALIIPAIAFAIKRIQDIDWQKAVVDILAMSAAIIAMGASIRLASGIDGKKNMKAFAGMSLSIAAISLSLIAFTYVDGDKLWKGAVAFSASVASVGLMFEGLSKIRSDKKTLIAVGSIALILGAILVTGKMASDPKVMSGIFAMSVVATNLIWALSIFSLAVSATTSINDDAVKNISALIASLSVMMLSIASSAALISSYDAGRSVVVILAALSYMMGVTIGITEYIKATTKSLTASETKKVISQMRAVAGIVAAMSILAVSLSVAGRFAKGNISTIIQLGLVMSALTVLMFAIAAFMSKHSQFQSIKNDSMADSLKSIGMVLLAMAAVMTVITASAAVISHYDLVDEVCLLAVAFGVLGGAVAAMMIGVNKTKHVKAENLTTLYSVMAGMVVLAVGLTGLAIWLNSSEGSVGKLWNLVGVCTVIAGVIVGLGYVLKEFERTYYADFGKVFKKFVGIATTLGVMVGLMAGATVAFQAFNVSWGTVGRISTVAAVALGIIGAVIGFYELIQLEAEKFNVSNDYKFDSVFAMIGKILLQMSLGLSAITGASVIVSKFSDVKTFATIAGIMPTFFASLAAIVYGLIQITKTTNITTDTLKDITSIISVIAGVGSVMMAMTLALAFLSKIMPDIGSVTTTVAAMYELAIALSGITVLFWAVGELMKLGGSWAGAVSATAGIIAAAASLAAIYVLADSLNDLTNKYEGSIDKWKPFIESITSAMLMLGLFALTAAMIGIALATATIALGAGATFSLALRLFLAAFSVIYDKHKNNIEGYREFANNLMYMMLSLAPVFMAAAALSVISVTATAGIIAAITTLLALSVFLGTFSSLLFILNIFGIDNSWIQTLTEFAQGVTKMATSLIPAFAALTAIGVMLPGVLLSVPSIIAGVVAISTLIISLNNVALMIELYGDTINDLADWLIELGDKLGNKVMNGLNNVGAFLTKLGKMNLFKLLGASILGASAMKAFKVFTGKGMFATIGEGLGEFATSMADFVREANKVGSWESADKAIDFLGTLIDKVSNLRLYEGSLLGALFGNNDLRKLALGLSQYAEEMFDDGGYIDLVSHISPNVFDESSSAVRAIEFLKTITNAMSGFKWTSGSVIGTLFGSNDFSQVGDALWEYSVGLWNFAHNVNLIDESSYDAMERAINFLPKVSFASLLSWDTKGSLLGFLLGNNDFGHFGESLRLYGFGLAQFSKLVDGITNWDNMDKSLDFLVRVSNIAFEITLKAIESIGLMLIAVAGAIALSLTLIFDSIAKIVEDNRQTFDKIIDYCHQLLENGLQDVFDLLGQTIGDTEWVKTASDGITEVVDAFTELNKSLTELIETVEDFTSKVFDKLDVWGSQIDSFKDSINELLEPLSNYVDLIKNIGITGLNSQYIQSTTQEATTDVFSYLFGDPEDIGRKSRVWWDNLWNGSKESAAEAAEEAGDAYVNTLDEKFKDPNGPGVLSGAVFAPKNNLKTTLQARNLGQLVGENFNEGKASEELTGYELARERQREYEEEQKKNAATAGAETGSGFMSTLLSAISTGLQTLSNKLPKGWKNAIEGFLGMKEGDFDKGVSIITDVIESLKTDGLEGGLDKALSIFNLDGLKETFTNLTGDDPLGLNGDNDPLGLEAANEKADEEEQKRLLSESQYWADLLEIRKNGADGWKYQDMDLADFQQQILDETQSMYDDYFSNLESSYNSFLGNNIFGAVDMGFDPENPFTKDEMFGNLQDQITQLDRYTNVMNSLNDRIDTEELRATINAMGVDSIEELETLNSLSEAELDNYEAMYVSKMEAAHRAAVAANDQSYRDTVDGINKLLGTNLDGDAIMQMFDGTMASLDNIVTANQVKMANIGTDINAGIAEGMTSKEGMAIIDGATIVLSDGVEDYTREHLKSHSPAQRMVPVGEDIVKGISVGMTDSNSMTSIKASSALVAAWYESEIKSKRAGFFNSGIYLMRGLSEGIESGKEGVLKAIERFSGRLKSTFETDQEIESPSKVWMQYGKYIDEGLAIGILNNTGNAENAVQQMSSKTLGIMQNAMSSAYDAMNSESVPAITPVVNMNKLQNGIRTMDTALAAQRSYLMANAANASIDTSVHKEVSINNQAAVDAITRLNGDILNLGDRLANMQIMLDTGIVAGQMAPAMNSELGTLMSRSIREGVG